MSSMRLVGIRAVLQIDQVLDRGEDVSRRSVGSSRSGISSVGPPCPPGCHVARSSGLEAELVVELQATDPRQVVALRVEEQVLEQVRRGLERRRIARAQAPVDLDDRLVLGRGLVGEQRVAERRAGEHGSRKRSGNSVDAALAELVEMRLGQLLVALEDDFAGRLVDDVHGRHALDGVFADQVLDPDRDPGRCPASSMRRRLALVNLRSFLTRTLPAPSLTSRVARWPSSSSGSTFFEIARLLAVHLDADRLGLVEVVEQLLGGVAERLQQHRRVDLAAAVDAGVEHVLVVELEVEPRAAVRNHAAGVDLLAGGADRGRRWSCRRRCRASGAAARR